MNVVSVDCPKTLLGDSAAISLNRKLLWHRSGPAQAVFYSRSVSAHDFEKAENVHFWEEAVSYSCFFGNKTHLTRAGRICGKHFS